MKKIEVVKLGGAFFVPKIIMDFKPFKDQTNRLYVVSAVRGVTRLLEIIFKISVQKDISDKFKKTLINISLYEFRKIHTELIVSLFDKFQIPVILEEFELLFGELKKTIYEKSVDDDQYCASILKFGELASSKILANYLLSIEVKNIWFDARDYVIMSGERDFIYTKARIISIQPYFEDFFSKEKTLITQGFIGKGNHGYDAVNGYDGSDDSAARFALALSDTNKVEVTFFKDVLGVYNGDPKEDKSSEFFSSMTSFEYLLLVKRIGSYVVRPDSIFNLGGKRIPINIRSYLDLDNPGTLINS